MLHVTNAFPSARPTWLFFVSIAVLGLLCLAAWHRSVPAAENWPGELGNHRVCVRVDRFAEAARVDFDWRLPRIRGVTVVDATTGKRIDNVVPLNVNRESCELVFQPVTGPGDYHLYFLAPYPVPPKPDPQWLQRNGLTPQERLENQRGQQLPQTTVLGFEAASDFDAFTTMERLAPSAEARRLLSRYPEQHYLLFPEDRKNPIRLTDALPEHWVRLGPRDRFEGRASRGEFYTFQIGVFAVGQTITDVDIAFDDLRPASGQGPTVPASAMRCFNQGGIDWMGRRFEKTITVSKGKVLPLWFGVQIPKEIEPGRFLGSVTISPDGALTKRVDLQLDIDQELLDDTGEGDLWRHARLRWLDSTIALDDQPPRPYTAVRVQDRTIECFGREVSLDTSGFPSQIRSFFSPDNLSVLQQGRPLLAAPMRMVVQEADGSTAAFSGGDVSIMAHSASAALWEWRSSVGNVSLRGDARMEFDGYVEYRLQVTADQPTQVTDLRLEVPLRRDVATYMMGMGRNGRLRAPEHDWRWDPARLQDAIWIGDVNAGLRLQLFGENYERPAIHEAKRPHLNLPPAWHNEGRGGCRIAETEQDTVVIRAFSGERTIHPGETLQFNFSLLLTPLKTLDMTQHWRDRYWHTPPPNYPSADEAARAGVNVINLHQGIDLNPHINYPFLTVDALKAYVDAAHAKGIRVKIYYTTRELSNYVTEMWALRSLRDEVFEFGPGNTGHVWLRDHLATGYLPAWQAPLPGGGMDAAIATRSVSRWHNYYLEGLRWLVKNVGIDGLYLDGISYDRIVFQRARKILDRGRPGSRIDWHQGNTFQPQYGMTVPAVRYMEFYPYVDRVWFGEMFDYGGSPEYWLTEISGIPFGVMGEMINGHRYFGPIYGMTSRKGWAWGANDPQALWKLWDSFGIADAKMIGYWVPSCPVKPDHLSVRATVYRKSDRCLIALASWSDKTEQCRLAIDWAALGLDPRKARLLGPAIEGLQPQRSFRPDDPIPINAKQGWLLVLDDAS